MRNHPFHTAIIAAGGNGSRMGSAQSKQTMLLDGVPVVIHTLRAFAQSDQIDQIVIVAKKGEEDWYAPQLKKYGISKVAKIVTGGDTRQASVLHGLKAVDDRTKYISIHDAARCLITPAQIEAVARAAYRCRCAAAASRAKDTVKTADAHGRITGTVDRNTVWLAATPQTFQTELYRACAYTALERGITATDDCMLAEAFGFSVQLVDCGWENLKITTPGDLVIAYAILQERKGAAWS